MNKTLDYAGNSNNGSGEKHLRSRQSVTQQPRYYSFSFVIHVLKAAIYFSLDFTMKIFFLISLGH